MTSLYIAGPMSGHEDLNFASFTEAAQELRDAGFEVVNPAELGEDKDWGWADYLKRDIVAMLGCDGVAMLYGWHKSAGASLEVSIAQELGMPKGLVRQWLRREV